MKATQQPLFDEPDRRATVTTDGSRLGQTCERVRRLGGHVEAITADGGTYHLAILAPDAQTLTDILSHQVP